MATGILGCDWLFRKECKNWDPSVKFNEKSGTNWPGRKEVYNCSFCPLTPLLQNTTTVASSNMEEDEERGEEKTQQSNILRSILQTKKLSIVNVIKRTVF
eukprot:m.58157 g.58157  ORF g.58157 m.58157 type:complete len:100 (-) comp7851_c5_seq2:124-423(-)